MEKKKPKVKKKSRAQDRINLRKYFDVAGYEHSPGDVWKILIYLSFFVIFVTYFVTCIFSIKDGTASDISYYFILLFSFIVLGLPLVLFAFVMVFYLYTDFRIMSRKRHIEKVLPDFLHITSSNIRAGMPIDQALWSSTKPSFGILSKEIEYVAKRNMVGEDLVDALKVFAEKYDSKIFRRTIGLIVEGIEAGSEIGDLLENIALSIQDIQARRDNMAANVTTYVIFIAFSVVVAAPLLFAVSSQLLSILHEVGGSLPGSDGAGAMGIDLTLSTDAVNEGDFKVFSIISLLISSVMASVIISAIKSGNASDSLKTFPFYVIISIIIYLFATWVLRTLFSGVF